MNPAQLSATLQACDLFKRLEHDQYKTLAQMVEVRRFRAQQAVFTCGERGEKLWVIASGRVEVRSPPPHAQPIATLKAHDVLGELAVLSPGERLATAVCVEDVTAIELTHGNLRMLEMSDPALAIAILAELRHRLGPWLDTCRTLTRQLYGALSAPAP
jgi:CRP/FNR family transcriptional regulator